MAVMDKFLDEQPTGNPQSGKDSEHAQRTEKVQRTGQILQQESNRNQIEEDAKAARDAIVRGSPLAINIANRHFTDRCSVPRRQRWNEPMKFSVEWNLLKHLPAVCFERSSEVVN